MYMTFVLFTLNYIVVLEGSFALLIQIFALSFLFFVWVNTIFDGKVREEGKETFYSGRKWGLVCTKGASLFPRRDSSAISYCLVCVCLDSSTAAHPKGTTFILLALRTEQSALLRLPCSLLFT